MILYRARGLQALHCVFQAIAAAAAFGMWVFVFDHILPKRQLIGSASFFLKYSILVGIAVVVDHLRTSNRKTDFLNLKFVTNCGISLRQTLTVLLMMLFSLVAFKHQTMSREFIFTFIPFFFVLMLLGNWFFPLGLARSVFSGNYVQNTILLGSRRGGGADQ